MAVSDPPGPADSAPASQDPIPRPRKTAAEKKAAEKKVTKATRKAAAKKTAAEAIGTAKKTAARKAGTARKAATANEPSEPPAAESTPPPRETASRKAATGKAATGKAEARKSAPPPIDPAPSESNPDPVRPSAAPEAGTDKTSTTPEVQTATGEERISTPQRQIAAPDGTATPDGIVTISEIVPVDRTASERTPRLGRQPSTVRRILDHPGYAPELLALAAVREMGPAARAWAARVRTAYPTATDDGLARLATRRYVRFSATGGVLSMATGLLAPLAELAVVIWAQAGLVLRVAAAHGHDPTDPNRAADLLVLTRVHPDQESARAALAAAEEVVSAVDDIGGDADESSHRLAEAGWRLGTPIIARTVNWLALRLAVRRLPGATTLVVALANTAVVERLAARSVAYYRGTATYRDTTSGPLDSGRSADAGPSSLGYNQSNQLRGSSA